MTSMTFTGTLLEKIKRTADSASFRFSRPPEYRFEAGQSYSITIPSPDGPLEHRFSHADSPTEPFTELTTRLTGSPFKNALDSLPIGRRGHFRGPAGRFRLPLRRAEDRLPDGRHRHHPRAQHAALPGRHRRSRQSRRARAGACSTDA